MIYPPPMNPRMYAMPRFPYGQATFPPNTSPIFGAWGYGQDLPELPPLPQLPDQPAANGLPHWKLAVAATGAGIAALGWSVGSGSSIVVGGLMAGFGLFTYPWGKVVERAAGALSPFHAGYGH